METKNLGDGGPRQAALRELIGEEVYAKRRDALDNAEAVREAARFMRSMREHAHLTQTALARRLGVSQARISEIERGASPEGVSYALLKRIASKCGFANWPSPPIDAVLHKAQREEPVVVEVVPSSLLKSRQEVIEACARVLSATKEIRTKIANTTTRDRSSATSGRAGVKIASGKRISRSSLAKDALKAYVDELAKLGKVLSTNVKKTNRSEGVICLAVVGDTEEDYIPNRSELAVQLVREALNQSSQVRVIDKQQ
jgi:transcriptional regulator with XRE-family HTH domain